MSETIGSCWHELSENRNIVRNVRLNFTIFLAKVTKAGGDFEYVIVSMLNFTAAEAFCTQNEGGHLVSIHSATEYALIVDMLSALAKK